jgi:hypothetical protein
MTLPPLPEPAYHHWGHALEGVTGYTEAQLLEYRAAVVEACAKVVDDEILNWDADRLLTAIARYIRELK